MRGSIARAAAIGALLLVGAGCPPMATQTQVNVDADAAMEPSGKDGMMQDEKKMEGDGVLEVEGSMKNDASMDAGNGSIDASIDAMLNASAGEREAQKDAEQDANDASADKATLDAYSQSSYEPN